MIERPILFSAPMVRALLAGTKTQTRRPVKLNASGRAARGGRNWHVDDPAAVLACPYGVPGDRLWVRETWTWLGGRGSERVGEFAELWVTYAADGLKRSIAPGGVVLLPKQPPQREGEVYSLRDAADDFAWNGENTYCDRLTRWWRRKIPAIHMPRWACRLVLEVVAVRVERLQEISEADAIAEGCTNSLHLRGGRFANENYAHLWDTINGDGAWDANPWVWVVEFRGC